MESMTGFGQGVTLRESFQVLCQIRSVNHRFLEISLKLPKRYTSIEERIRRHLADAFTRGKLELTLKVTGFVGEKKVILFDLEMVKALKENLENLKRELSLPGEITLAELLEFRDWVLFGEKEEDTERLWEEVAQAIEGAISDLKRARLLEGAKLKERLREYLLELGKLSKHLEDLKEEVRQENMAKFRERLERLLKEFQVSLDEGRFYQEVAILLDRMDFSEELERFKIHLQHMEKLLEEENSGKKLDFLCQELHREINTLSNKAQSAKISGLAVEIKDLIEKIREQVQNVV